MYYWRRETIRNFDRLRLELRLTSASRQQKLTKGRRSGPNRLKFQAYTYAILN